MSGLKTSEIHWVVSAYIGVSGGYLGDFTYKSHREFYPAYCDLCIDPDDYPGNTTREKFIEILNNASAPDQAAILRGISRLYPAESEARRTQANYQQLLALIKKCTDSAAVAPTDPKISSDLVRRALADATALSQSSGPTSAVDRVHTALHAYLKAACTNAAISMPDDLNTTGLFKLLRAQHPALSSSGPHDDTMARILSSLSNIIDSFNPARNRGSLAHANEHLLDRYDATLVINSARTVIQYLDAKLLGSK